MTDHDEAQAQLVPQPDPALRRLDRFMGTWTMERAVGGFQREEHQGRASYLEAFRLRGHAEAGETTRPPRGGAAVSMSASEDPDPWHEGFEETGGGLRQMRGTDMLSHGGE